MSNGADELAIQFTPDEAVKKTVKDFINLQVRKKLTEI